MRKGEKMRLSLINSALSSAHGAHTGIAEFLHNTLGNSGVFIDEVIIHSVLDTLKLVLFLFITYLLMELIEHRSGDGVNRLLKRSGAFGPFLGGLLGMIPQCGFSAAADNLYTGRVITLGTLIAVFLSTSDEMIPVLLAGDMDTDRLLLIVAYKTCVGVFIGYLIDIALRLMRRERREINIDELCDNDNCHCERGIFYSAIHHTVTTGTFILLTTMTINLLIFFIGEDNISRLMVNIPIVSHFICSLIGLIPNCAVSVVLSQFASSGFITYGSMLSGLLTGAGVGLLVLFKVNKNERENFIIMAILVLSGTVFGSLAELLPFI